MLAAMSLSTSTARAPSSHALSCQDMTDEALMARVAQGHGDAFSELVDRYLPRLVSVSQRVVLRRAEAEEIAQEIFLKIWQKPLLFNEQKGKFSTWVLRSTMNASIDAVRKVRPVALPEHIDIEDPAVSTLETLISEEERQSVWRAIEQLPARQRAALVLSYQKELPDLEGAAALGVSRKAYEALLMRGKKALRQILFAKEVL